MTNSDLVRWSRDGDQFHYVWAARQCLELLSGSGGLSAVSIEGASAGESEDDAIEAGEELIDVGLYYGAESRSKATAIHYVQLKHSTTRSSEPWTASGLKNTLSGFGKRYLEMVAETSVEDVSGRFRFRFTTKRHERRLYGDGETRHSHGGLPRAEDLGSYHGYHSMMLTAGQLLREYPVGRRENDAENDFDEWIKSYRLTRSDGGWLFDRADPALLGATDEKASRSSDWPWKIDPDHLAAQLTAPDGRTVVWGSWETGSDDRRETTTIRSALVTDSAAEALLAALQTAPDPGRHFLPAADQDDDVELADGRLFGWIEDRATEAGMDEFDPWAERLRYPAAAPSGEIITRLGLKTEADGRIWRGESGDLLSESWTVHQGYGREAETVPGWRLSASALFIPTMLEAYPRHCMILGVKMRRPPAKWHKDVERYPWPYFKYFLMGSDGRPRSL